MKNNKLINRLRSLQTENADGVDNLRPMTEQEIEDFDRIRCRVEKIYQPVTDAVRESQGISWQDLIIRINS